MVVGFVAVLYFLHFFFLFFFFFFTAESNSVAGVHRAGGQFLKRICKNIQSHLAINTQPFVSLFPEPFGLLLWITMGSCARTEILQSVVSYHQFHNLRTLSCNF